jgi:hypothetical protein
MGKRLAVTLVSMALILAGCYPEEWVAVSPDGKAIVYSNIRPSGVAPRGVFWLALDGSSAKRLAAEGWDPQFSPDGRYCAFEGVTSGERVDLVLYDLTTDTSRALRTWLKTEEESRAPYVLVSWRPDGKELAYVAWYIGKPGDQEQMTTELHLLELADQQDRKVAENVGIHCGWSPDGKRLAFYQREEGPLGSLGSLRILEGGETASVAGLLLDPYADITWLSNDRILFVSPKISLPTSEREKNDVQEAVFAYDLVTRSVGLLQQTEGLSWKQLSSFLRLSPDGRRLLYGTARDEGGTAGQGKPPFGGGSPVLTLWCYTFASSQRMKLAEGIHDTYPFWVSNNEVGYVQVDHTIVIATIDENAAVRETRTLNLDDLLAKTE